MNGKGFGRKSSWPKSGCYRSTCVEGLSKTTKNLSNDHRSPGWDFNSAPPECECYHYAQTHPVKFSSTKNLLLNKALKRIPRLWFFWFVILCSIVGGDKYLETTYYPEKGGKMSLRNVGVRLQNCTIHNPKDHILNRCLDNVKKIWSLHYRFLFHLGSVLILSSRLVKSPKWNLRIDFQTKIVYPFLTHPLYMLWPSISSYFMITLIIYK